MAKKKKIEASDIERSIQNTLSSFPGIRALPEAEYCELVLEALDGIKTGLEMRKSELEEGGDDNA